MNKSILVVDTPENCEKCDMLSEGIYCQAHKCDYVYDYIAENVKPDWCPLKYLPDKEDILDCFDNYDRGYYVCRNAFIDEILKGENN